MLYALEQFTKVNVSDCGAPRTKNRNGAHFKLEKIFFKFLEIARRTHDIGANWNQRRKKDTEEKDKRNMYSSAASLRNTIELENWHSLCVPAATTSKIYIYAAHVWRGVLVCIPVWHDDRHNKCIQWRGAALGPEHWKENMNYESYVNSGATVPTTRNNRSFQCLCNGPFKMLCAMYAVPPV